DIFWFYCYSLRVIGERIVRACGVRLARLRVSPKRVIDATEHIGTWPATQNVACPPMRPPGRRLQERNAMAQSYDKIDGVIWYDGKLVRWADANVHVLTHGLHYASCVFEGERAYGGKIFKGTEHSERLKASARILDFEIPYSVAEIDAAKQLVVERNGKPNAYVRPVAWRGSEMMGVSAQNNTIHVAIAAWEWPSYFDPAERLKGIRLDLADYRRPDPKTAPCLAKA